jgi:hypothetical protein
MINVKMHWVGDENGPCGILEGGMMPPVVPAIQFYIFRSMTFRSHSDDFAGLQLSSFYSILLFPSYPVVFPICALNVAPIFLLPPPPPLPSSAVFPAPPPCPSAIFLPHSHYSSSLFTPSPSSSAVFLPVPTIIL